jgi:hypothetical protein
MHLVRVDGMYVIQLLLPLADNTGRRLPRTQFARVREELTARFGGVTAYSRAPAEGLWVSNDTGVSRDDVVVVEVMAAELDAAWWAVYRTALEGRFHQEEVVIRAWQAERL